MAGFSFKKCPRCGGEIIPPRGHSKQAYMFCAWCVAHTRNKGPGYRNFRIREAAVSHPPYIELFARPPHPPNWEVWGNEAESDARESNLESYNLPGDVL
jgi:hypothetical protein